MFLSPRPISYYAAVWNFLRFFLSFRGRTLALRYYEILIFPGQVKNPLFWFCPPACYFELVPLLRSCPLQCVIIAPFFLHLPAYPPQNRVWTSPDRKLLIFSCCSTVPFPFCQMLGPTPPPEPNGSGHQKKLLIPNSSPPWTAASVSFPPAPQASEGAVFTQVVPPALPQSHLRYPPYSDLFLFYPTHPSHFPNLDLPLLRARPPVLPVTLPPLPPDF